MKPDMKFKYKNKNKMCSLFKVHETSLMGIEAENQSKSFFKK